MTREEMLNELYEIKNWKCGGDAKMHEVVTEAIKALEQELVLDKIRAEIKAMFPPSGSWMYEEGHEMDHTVCEVLANVLQIIDKYKAESEE